jgi:hypothetical protein
MCDQFPEVCVSSFAFKFGTPDANVVLDVRFLPDPRSLEHANPYLTGKHRAVEDFIRANSSFDTFFHILTERVAGVLRHLQDQGYSKVGLAFGCTAGKHRSVFVAEHLARWLREQMNHQKVMVCHRDMASEDDKIRSHVLGYDDESPPLGGDSWEEVEIDHSGEVPECFRANCGPRLKYTYHPDTVTLETYEFPGLQRPECSRQVQEVLGSGLTKLKTLREKRAREIDATTGSDFSASCNDLHALSFPKHISHSQTI